MSPSDLERVAALASFFSGDLVELFADEDRLRELRERTEPIVEPDATTTFHPAGLMPTARGVDGLIEAWRTWVEPWASYRLDVERVFQDGDRVVVLVRQVGRTVHDHVDVPSPPSAAVFVMRNGRAARATFYLDRVAAAAEEGFELP